MLVVAFVLFRFHVCGSEIVAGYQHLSKELSLECNPFELFVEIALRLVGSCRREFVGVIVGGAIGDGAVAVFEVESFLLLAHAFCPHNVHRLGFGGEETAEVLGCDVHAEYVRVGQQSVLYVDCA